MPTLPQTPNSYAGGGPRRPARRDTVQGEQPAWLLFDENPDSAGYRRVVAAPRRPGPGISDPAAMVASHHTSIINTPDGAGANGNADIEIDRVRSHSARHQLKTKGPTTGYSDAQCAT